MTLSTTKICNTAPNSRDYRNPCVNNNKEERLNKEVNIHMNNRDGNISDPPSHTQSHTKYHLVMTMKNMH